MLPEKWEKIKAIFNETVELPPDEWDFVFKSANGADAEILAEVRKLLDAERRNNFENPVAEIAHLWQTDEAEDFIGRQIRCYKITGEIGRGGMGIVFEARREGEDFLQIVALKLLKRGMDSDEMLRRFRSERQILASLEHPHIARLLDGGITEDNLQFFAMEFVAGQPIDEYCDKKNLTVNQRLRLFLQICQAVSFAHSRLVVHRDLKPNNIFVTADGTVKLLDFGIAKIISPENDYKTQTVTSLGMMTPQYASPEQIKGEIVSTASDIYSLGLILYELLTGISAYNFPNQRPDEIAKIICENEPPRPSSVVSSQWSVIRNTTNSEQRTTNKITQNPKSLRGDLDNIILKALRKEPARRYASVEQFAGDISRHLEGLPVIACPDTFSYRAEKFIKRNRGAVASAALIFIILLIGITATFWQYQRAERERQTAEKRFDQVRKLANNIIYKYHDGIAELPGSIKVRETLITDVLNYLDELNQDVSDNTDLQIEIADTFSRIAKLQFSMYSNNVGKLEESVRSYEKTQLLREKLLDKDKNNPQMMTALADTYVSIADEEYIINDENSAKINYEKAKSLYKKVLELKDTNPIRLKLANVLIRQFSSLDNNPALGIENFRKVIELTERILQKDPENKDAQFTLSLAHEYLGKVLGHPEMSEIGDLKQAEAELSESLSIRQKLLSFEPTNTRLINSYIIALTSLSDIFFAEKKFQAALKNYREAFQMRERLYAQDTNDSYLRSAYTYNAMRFASVLSVLGRYHEATTILDKSKFICREFYLPDPTEIPEVNTCAKVYIASGENELNQQNLKKALSDYKRALEILEKMIKTLGNDTEIKGTIAFSNYKIGKIYLQQKDKKNAAETFRKSLAQMEEIKKTEPLKVYLKEIYRENSKLSAFQNIN